MTKFIVLVGVVFIFGSLAINCLGDVSKAHVARVEKLFKEKRAKNDKDGNLR
jgi:hypothetical protein